jgi:hypothetical protein
MEMTIVRVPSHRVPTHPGEMLLQEFLLPLGLTQRKLASASTSWCVAGAG